MAYILAPLLLGLSVLPSSPTEIDRLIDQLGSSAFRKREQAALQLELIGTPAMTPLRLASRESTDAEIRRRAERLLLAIGKRDIAQLQGMWVVISWEYEGREVPPKELRRFIIVECNQAAI